MCICLHVKGLMHLHSCAHAHTHAHLVFLILPILLLLLLLYFQKQNPILRTSKGPQSHFAVLANLASNSQRYTSLCIEILEIKSCDTIHSLSSLLRLFIIRPRIYQFSSTLLQSCNCRCMLWFFLCAGGCCKQISSKAIYLTLSMK